MKNDKRILNLEDLDNNIEIFGNKFELEFSEEYIQRLRNINIRNIEDNNVFEKLKEMLNLILNDSGAYDKIKSSYETKKKKEFGLQTFIKVFEFIFAQYVEEMNNMSKNITNIAYKPQNREQRRNNQFNRRNNYRGNNNYRRY